MRLPQRLLVSRVTRQQDGFKGCDFWIGGISSTVFSPVGNDTSIWTALLQATCGWEDIYKNDSDDELEGLRRSMNPGAAEDERHWGNWADFAAMRNIKENETDEDEEYESMNED